MNRGLFVNGKSKILLAGAICVSLAVELSADAKTGEVDSAAVDSAALKAVAVDSAAAPKPNAAKPAASPKPAPLSPPDLRLILYPCRR